MAMKPRHLALILGRLFNTDTKEFFRDINLKLPDRLRYNTKSIFRGQNMALWAIISDNGFFMAESKLLGVIDQK